MEMASSMDGRPAETTEAENEARKTRARQKWEADGLNGRKKWNEKKLKKTTTPAMGDGPVRDRDGVREKENEEIQSWWVRKWWMGWKWDWWAGSISDLWGREMVRVSKREPVKAKHDDDDEDLEKHTHTHTLTKSAQRPESSS